MPSDQKINWEEWVNEVAVITGDDPKFVRNIVGFVWVYKDHQSPSQGAIWVENWKKENLKSPEKEKNKNENALK